MSILMRYINTIAELKELLDSRTKLKLYGAGYYLDLFLEGIKDLNKEYIKAIECILVSNVNGNPKEIRGIPVFSYQAVDIEPGDYILLTLGHRYEEEICNLLKDTEAIVIRLEFNLFWEETYKDVVKSIQPFIDNFAEQFHFEKTILEDRTKAWTCWWQGEENMPDIVRACLNSQQRNLPEGVEHVVITKDNYYNYITLPLNIITKVENGDISLAHLADIIRCMLLYKYGGFWFDATLLITEHLKREIMSYPIYTRTMPEKQYYADLVWAIWFLYSKPGNKLFRFLSDGLLYYFSVHGRLKHYFTLDYMIAIACNNFPEIEKQMKDIPYNNGGALELGKHLKENFNREAFENYIRGTSVQKLTYKLNWAGREEKGTVYGYILRKYL